MRQASCNKLQQVDCRKICKQMKYLRCLCDLVQPRVIANAAGVPVWHATRPHSSLQTVPAACRPVSPGPVFGEARPPPVWPVAWARCLRCCMQRLLNGIWKFVNRAGGSVRMKKKKKKQTALLCFAASCGERQLTKQLIWLGTFCLPHVLPHAASCCLMLLQFELMLR